LKVTLDRENLERIYPPYLEINYEEKRVENIRSDDVTQRLKTVSFTSEYIMETDGFWKVAKVFFWILIGIIGLIAIIKSCIFF